MGSGDGQWMTIPVSEFEMLHGELAAARVLPDQLLLAIKWNEEKRGEQAREIERLQREVKAAHDRADTWRSTANEALAKQPDHAPQGSDAEVERLRDTMVTVLKRIDQSEQYEREAILLRDALGLCVTTGCENQRSGHPEWEEYCSECIDP